MAPPPNAGTLHPHPSMNMHVATEINWGWVLCLGVVLSVVGLMAIAIPLSMSIVVELFAGWALMVGGLIQIFQTFTIRQSSSFWLSGVLALLAFTCGLFLLAEPLRGLMAITALLAIYFLADGVSKLAWGYQLRAHYSTSWLYFSGVVSMLLSVLIWKNLPGDALWIIGLLVGINLLFSGIAMIIVSLTLRNVTEQQEQTDAMT